MPPSKKRKLTSSMETETEANYEHNLAQLLKTFEAHTIESTKQVAEAEISKTQIGLHNQSAHSGCT